MWVSHTVRNVGPAHLGFPFRVGPLPSYRSLQGYLQLHFPHLWVRHTVNYINPRPHVGPPHCEECGSVTFRISLSGQFATSLPQFTGVFVTTFPSLVGPPHIIPLHMWVGHTVRNEGHTQDFSFRWVRHLPHSVTMAFRATRILSTVGVGILVERSLQSYQKSCKQWELTFLSTVAFRATKTSTTLRADVPVAFRTIKNLEDTMPPVN